MKHKAVFITGTDTGVGKTFVSLALMLALQNKGYKVNGMKPVACGCSETGKGLRNPDAQQLQGASSVDLDYDLVNPFAYQPPISPNIAASMEERPVCLERVAACFQVVGADSDYVVLEGVGGWKTPFSSSLFALDLVRRLEIPVLLVVGLKLGCINHALLTAASLIGDGVDVVGWLANDFSGQYESKIQTLKTLKEMLSAPLLATIPGADNKLPLDVTDCFDLGPFFVA